MEETINANRNAESVNVSASASRTTQCEQKQIASFDDKKKNWLSTVQYFSMNKQHFFPNPTECSQNIKPSWPLCPNWLNQVISRETELDIIFFTVAGYSLVTVCDSFAFLLTPSSRDRHVLLIGQSPVRLVYFNS